ncbi:metalloregulator ArsR/SmtB family transcription factor [Paenibacillus radicis (ex Xue et al. 2023)]|uniref:Metalloregulator ArsR/SmtB family transcription factor n=1 Tax=Paenibacillus radicis (ex Xue et al. 2023) TaxID=2972489 RepID=A0ABT1YJD1_9BACL|nr:metalloregulator ArsR/SmtB family transcription factor [Paenibacillus radicis (ex Xue et al. 2023)]MCR8632519.1 metalloregulator ArsR/SmtB family transcription factor [Paenibacillus radicis (ex Xue et al. 2023)]
MQLDKVVNYHKALADRTRIRILILLSEGELNGQVLAEKLSLSPATITHHAAKLREASLINERRDKNTIYFTLNHYFIKNNAQAALDLIYKQVHSEGGAGTLDESSKLFMESVIRNFFTSEGTLKHIPAQLKKKLIVLEHLVSQLEKGRKYSEQELNEFIKKFHGDFATIRREFIMHQFMYRESEIYELNPREMWAKWEKLS